MANSYSINKAIFTTSWVRSSFDWYPQLAKDPGKSEDPENRTFIAQNVCEKLVI